MTGGGQQLIEVARHAPEEPAASASAAPTAKPVATVVAAAQPIAQPIAPPGAARSQPLNQQSPAGAAVPVSVPAQAPAATAVPAAPPGRPPRTRTVVLPLLRIVCWQVALVLAFLAIGKPWPVGVGLLVSAAVLLVGTASRSNGRWLSDELAGRAGLLLRRWRAESPDGGGEALLRTLAPGTRAYGAELAGTRAGVVSGADELFAVLRPIDTEAGAFVRLALSGELLPGSTEPGVEQPETRLRLVLHRGPQRTDPTRVWLTVRALRSLSFPGDAELLVAATNAVRKLHRRFRRAGMGASLLPEPELMATLVALTHTGGGRNTVREDRRYWRAGPISQIGMRVCGLGTPAVPARVSALHRLLGAVPGVACTVAITVPEHDAVLRIAATTDAAADAAAERLQRMPPPGLRLERLDNQHAPAVAASSPIGGNP